MKSYYVIVFQKRILEIRRKKKKSHLPLLISKLFPPRWSQEPPGGPPGVPRGLQDTPQKPPTGFSEAIKNLPDAPQGMPRGP